MKDAIVKEAAAEAATYDKFSCFCKDTTEKKSKSVTDGQDTIDKLSAAIADNTATKAADQTNLQELKDKKEALSADLEGTTNRCAAEKAEYEGMAADFNKALKSLKSSIKAMGDKKKALQSVTTRLMQLDVGSGLRETLE